MLLFYIHRPVGMPKMEKVYLHNPSSEEISLISISATTAHFHASFFQNRVSSYYHLHLFLIDWTLENVDCCIFTEKNWWSLVTWWCWFYHVTSLALVLPFALKSEAFIKIDQCFGIIIVNKRGCNQLIQFILSLR